MENREYEQFVEDYRNTLQQHLNQGDDQVEVIRTTANKVNGERDGLTIKYADSNIAPTVYVDDAYERLVNGTPIREIIEDTERAIERARADAPRVPAINAEMAKKNLYATLINQEKNEELLKKVPYKKFNDLAIIARCSVGDNASFIVNKDNLQMMQLLPEEALEIALDNSRKQEYSVRSLNDIICGIAFPDGASDELMLSSEESDIPEIYVVTNKQQIDGSIAIACPQVMKKIEQQFGEEFYVLPSSRHEVLVLPKSMAPEGYESLEEIVRQVNDSAVDERDFLSDRVYLYSGRKLQLAEMLEKELVREQVPVQEMTRARAI